MEQPPEVWKDVQDYPGYRISSFGQVFSNKLKRVIEGEIDKDGYRVIGIWKSQKDKIKMFGE